MFMECLIFFFNKSKYQFLYGVSSYLFNIGFQYFPLGHIQSYQIENEFSIYRQSTGTNIFMIAGNVLASYKNWLTKFSALHLKKIESTSSSVSTHIFVETTYDVAENLCQEELLLFEEYCVCYVAGWIEAKILGLQFQSEDLEVKSASTAFTFQLSRDLLTVLAARVP